MLPEVLSNDLCSLNPNTKKLTLTVDMEVNRNGKVISTNIYESIIESNYRLTYNEVTKLLNKETDLINDDPILTKMLLEAYELALVSRKRKIKKGMIDFSLPEIKVILDEVGNPLDLEVKYQTVSEKLIEDLMVLTNESVALYLGEKNVPALFRIHMKPQEENMNKFKDNLKFFGHIIDKVASEIENIDLMNLVKNLPEDEHS
jgi:ribonuclease R